MRRLLVVAALLLALPFAASAHTRSETRSAWQIEGSVVRLQFTVPDLEARRITPDGTLPSAAVLGAYIAGHVGVSAGGVDCPQTQRPYALAGAPGYSRQEFAFRCPAADGLILRSSGWFELVGSHTNFAQVQDGRGHFIEALFTADHLALDLADGVGGNPLDAAGWLDFVGMGVMHILTGVDHMSFMLGLVLISRRLRDLLFVVSGFTLGHSLTLALAVTGLLRPQAQCIDALVALTIALIGAENVVVALRRPLPVALGLGSLMAATAVASRAGVPVILPGVLLVGAGLFAVCYLMLSGRLADAGRLRLVVTLMFGLIHGFGFASNLLEMRLPAGRLAELLVGFNLGVELGQVTVVIGAWLLAAGLVQVRLALPRPIVTDVGAAFLMAEGCFWFLGRAVSV